MLLRQSWLRNIVDGEAQSTTLEGRCDNVAEHLVDIFTESQQPLIMRRTSSLRELRRWQVVERQYLLLSKRPTSEIPTKLIMSINQFSISW